MTYWWIMLFVPGIFACLIIVRSIEMIRNGEWRR